MGDTIRPNFLGVTMRTITFWVVWFVCAVLLSATAGFVGLACSVVFGFDPMM